jgi:3-hydroxyisobutyrate dehydrogenase-like beta-hydroxyacid dehydrogenase
VGIIGIGNMGSAMAENLVKAGFRTIGVDTDPSRTNQLVSFGGEAAPDPASVAAEADVVILSLPSVSALQSVLHGEGGLLSRPRAGVICIESGTFPIVAKQEARAALATVGMELVDCTVSGTGAQARSKDIVLFTSGPEELLARCRPIFEAIAREAPRVGDFGAGSVMKFVSNLLVTVHTVAAAEALTLAARCGLDPQETLRLITSGSGNSRILELRGPMMVSGDYDQGSSSLDSLAKDTEIILGFAGEYACPVPMLATAAMFLRSATSQGLSRLDPAVVHEVLGAMAGLDSLLDTTEEKSR